MMDLHFRRKLTNRVALVLAVAAIVVFILAMLFLEILT